MSTDANTDIDVSLSMRAVWSAMNKSAADNIESPEYTKWFVLYIL